MPRKPRADPNKYKTFLLLAYVKQTGNFEDGLKGTGYFLDNEMSDREHKVFYNPETYRGTDMRDLKGIKSDLRSIFNTLLSRETVDKWFKNANVPFQQAEEKYNFGYHRAFARRHSCSTCEHVESTQVR